MTKTVRLRFRTSGPLNKVLNGNYADKSENSETLLSRSITPDTNVDAYFLSDPRARNVLASAVDIGALETIRQKSKKNTDDDFSKHPLKIPFRTAENRALLDKTNRLLAQQCVSDEPIKPDSPEAQQIQTLFRSLMKAILTEGLTLAGIETKEHTALSWFERHGLDQFRHALPTPLSSLPYIRLLPTVKENCTVSFSPTLRNVFSQTRYLAYSENFFTGDEQADEPTLDDLLNTNLKPELSLQDAGSPQIKHLKDNAAIIHDLARNSRFDDWRNKVPLFEVNFKISVSPVFTNGQWITVANPDSVIDITPVDFSQPTQDEEDTTGCDIIKVNSLPDPNNLNTLEISSPAAYIRCANNLYYVNKVTNQFYILELEPEKLLKFDAIVSLPTLNGSKKLTESQLARISVHHSHFGELTQQQQIFKLRQLLTPEQRVRMQELQESYSPFFEDLFPALGGYIDSFEEEKAAFFKESDNTALLQLKVRCDTLFGVAIKSASHIAELHYERNQPLNNNDLLSTEFQRYKDALLPVLRQLTAAGYLSPLQTHRDKLLKIFTITELAEISAVLGRPFFTTNEIHSDQVSTFSLQTINLSELALGLNMLRKLKPADAAIFNIVPSQDDNENIHINLLQQYANHLLSKSASTTPLPSIPNTPRDVVDAQHEQFTHSKRMSAGDASLDNLLKLSFEQTLALLSTSKPASGGGLSGNSRRDEVDGYLKYLRTIPLTQQQQNYLFLLDTASGISDHASITALESSLTLGSAEETLTTYWQKFLTAAQIQDFNDQLERAIPDVTDRHQALLAVDTLCPEFYLRFSTYLKQVYTEVDFPINQAPDADPESLFGILNELKRQILADLATYQDQCFSYSLEQRYKKLKELSDKIIDYSVHYREVRAEKDAKDETSLSSVYYLRDIPTQIQKLRDDLQREIALVKKLDSLPSVDPRLPTTVCARSLPASTDTVIDIGQAQQQPRKNWWKTNKRKIWGAIGIVTALLAAVGIAVVTAGIGAAVLGAIALLVIKFGIGAGVIGAFTSAAVLHGENIKERQQILTTTTVKKEQHKTPRTLPVANDIIAAWVKERDLLTEFGLTKAMAAHKVLEMVTANPTVSLHEKLLKNKSFQFIVVNDDSVRRTFLKTVSAEVLPSEPLTKLRNFALENESNSLFYRDPQLMAKFGRTYNEMPIEPAAAWRLESLTESTIAATRAETNESDISLNNFGGLFDPTLTSSPTEVSEPASPSRADSDSSSQSSLDPTLREDARRLNNGRKSVPPRAGDVAKSMGVVLNRSASLSDISNLENDEGAARIKETMQTYKPMGRVSAGGGK